MKSQTRSLVLFVILLLLIGAYILSIQSAAPRYNWEEHFRADSRDPYGTEVLKELVADYISPDSLVLLTDSLYRTLPDRTGATYIFVGKEVSFDSIDSQALLDFAARGNRVFIASTYIPHSFFRPLIDTECLVDSFSIGDYSYENDVELNFNHPSLRLPTPYRLVFQYQRDTLLEYSWNFLSDEAFQCGQDWIKLGLTDEEGAYFAKIPFGKGEIYFHTIPLSLTNYGLLRAEGFEYARRVFAHLPASAVYWDDYSDYYKRYQRQADNEFDPWANRTFEGEGPLLYILSQPPLAWAWYILLGLGLLYLVFRAKRRQRVIPVLAPNVNTSLEFVQLIGRLYFEKQSHRKLALLKMRLFLAHVRHRYFISGKDLDQHFVRQLAIRSQAPQEAIEKILLFYNNIQRSQFLSENSLIEFHQLLEAFYRQAK